MLCTLCFAYRVQLVMLFFYRLCFVDTRLTFFDTLSCFLDTLFSVLDTLSCFRDTLIYFLDIRGCGSGRRARGWCCARCVSPAACNWLCFSDTLFTFFDTLSCFLDTLSSFLDTLSCFLDTLICFPETRGCGSARHARGSWFRGGLVFKAHRLVYHSTLGWRVIKKKKKKVCAVHVPIRLPSATGYEGSPAERNLVHVLSTLYVSPRPRDEETTQLVVRLSN